jgi:hypothetical protein
VFYSLSHSSSSLNVVLICISSGQGKCKHFFMWSINLQQSSQSHTTGERNTTKQMILELNDINMRINFGYYFNYRLITYFYVYCFIPLVFH